MKFMVTWKVHEDKRHDALKVFSNMSDEESANETGDVRLIGRWHDVIGFTGTAIAETDDPEALAAWLLKWNGIIDILSVPVLDDEEARTVGRRALGSG